MLEYSKLHFIKHNWHSIVQIETSFRMQFLLSLVLATLFSLPAYLAFVSPILHLLLLKNSLRQFWLLWEKNKWNDYGNFSVLFFFFFFPVTSWWGQCKKIGQMYIQYVCVFVFYPFNKDRCCLEISFLKGLIHILCINWPNTIFYMKILLRNYDSLLLISSV